MKKVFAILLASSLILSACNNTKVNIEDYDKLKQEVAEYKENNNKLMQDNEELKSLIIKYENESGNDKINDELSTVKELLSKEDKIDFNTIDRVKEGICARRVLIEKYLSARDYYLSHFIFYGGYKTLSRSENANIYKEYGYDIDKFKGGSLLGEDNKLTKFDDIVAEIKTYFSESMTKKILNDNFQEINSLEEVAELTHPFIVCNDFIFTQWFDSGTSDEDEIVLYHLADFNYIFIDIENGIIDGIVRIPVLSYEAFGDGKVDGGRCDEYKVRYVRKDGIWKIDDFSFGF